jgi:hypothetical protein
MMLAESRRPPHDVAAVVVPSILRRTYLSHCRVVLTLAVGMMLPALGLHLAG